MIDRVRADDNTKRAAASFRLQLATLASLLATIFISTSCSNAAASPMHLDQPLVHLEPVEVDEIYYDAPDKMQDAVGELYYDAPDEMQDAADELFYDAEDEINYDEDVEANVCITAGRGECESCCRRSELNNPFWNQQVGHCLCYGEVYEEGICTDSSRAELCEKCCADNHYLDWNFDPSGRSITMCTCLTADRDFYQRSFR